MRRVAVVSSGSVGDVRPYAVLAAGFARAGWDAGLVANDGYGALARSLDVPWFAPALPPLDGLVAWQKRATAGEEGLFDARVWDAWFAAYPRLVAALAGAQVVISRIPWVGDAARMAGIPFVLAANLTLPRVRADVPYVPTGASIGAMVRRRRAARRIPGAPALLNLASYLALPSDRLRLLWRERRSFSALSGLRQRHIATLASLADAAGRTRLAAGERPLLEMVGLSPHLVPPRVGERFTGAWRAPTASYRPPARLARMLAEGPPPVFIGFGSNAALPNGADFAALSRQVAAAVRQAGVRAIIAPGWGGLTWPDAEGSEDALVLDGVPHDWLFPRLAAVVHHCGVGTTLAALGAGVPSVPVPFAQDMPFWAWRLHDLGVAAAPLDPSRLTSGELAAAIRSALDDGAMRAEATKLGDLMRREDGLGEAVRLVEQALTSRRRKGR